MYGTFATGGGYPFPWAGTAPAPAWGQPQDPNAIQGVRFVDGVEEARNCTAQPGTRVLLMDRNRNRFFIKEQDLSGVSTLEEFEFSPVRAKPPVEYVTREEFDQLRRNYESVVQRINQQTPTAPNATADGLHQNDIAGAGQGPSGAAYPGPWDQRG